MLDNAESNILSDPASFVGAVSSLVAPFGFADAIFSYESGVLDGLRSVVAIQVGVSVPTQATGTSRSSGGGVPTATMGAAAAAAVGALVVGIGLL